MAQILIENLVHTYPGGTSLEIPSCRFGGSEAGVICGPAGSGKSTLARLVAGLLQPSAGVIKNEKSGVFARSLVYLAMTPGILSWAGNSIFEEFNLMAEFRGLYKNDRNKSGTLSETISAYLSNWRIPADPKSDPRTLSASLQARLVLCLAEFSQAPVLFVDGLIEVQDPDGMRAFLESIDRLKKADRSVYVCSNEIERFLAHMDRMILLKEGKLILDALPERVLPFLDAHGLRKPGMKLKEMSWLTGKA